MAERVEICEVGPRDGLQIARGTMPTVLKLRWIEALAGAGLREIEVGSFVPPRLVPQMADTAAVVAGARRISHLRVIALAPNLRGAQAAAVAGAARITVPVSVSEGHSRANTNRSTDEQVAEVGRILAWTAEAAPAMEVEAACSTAFGCSIDGFIEASRVIEVATALASRGVRRIVLADTVGYANPAQVRALVHDVRAAIGERLVGLHLHDTLGLGLANALAGLDAGIRRFDAALAGLGGCPFAPGAKGNVCTEDLALMLAAMGFATGIDMEKLLATRAFLADGLPEDTLHGSLAQAGLPRVYDHLRATSLS